MARIAEDLVGLIGQLVIEDDPNPFRKEVLVPLQGVDVKAEAVDFVAEVKLIQSYWNSESRSIEAKYVFPVDEGGAVCGFEAELEDGTIVRGECKKKEQAAQEYREAIRQGKQASLLESTKRDVFSLSVGNIAPGASVKISITYITTLKAEGDASSFYLPTYLAPRYCPSTRVGGARSEDVLIKHGTAADTSYSSVKFFGVNMHINYTCRSTIKTILSPTHSNSISVHLKGKSASVVLEDVVPSKDIVLLCTEEKPHEPRASLEIAADGSLAGFVTLFPSVEFKDEEREFVILVDCSGSMREKCSDGRSKIEQAQQALQLFLQSLPENCWFNVILFGSTFNSLFSNARKYNNETLAAASSFAKNLSANLGGTEILKPLQHIFDQKVQNKAERQVFVVTDGQVWNDSQIFALIRKQQKCRLFCLGVGNGVSHHLVEGMARAGRGTAKFVKDGSQELRSTVLKQLKQALQPGMDQVSITWNFPKTSEEAKSQSALTQVKTLLGYRSPAVDHKRSGLKVRNFPSVVPPIFHQERFLCYAMFPAECKEIPESVTVTSVSPDGPLAVTILLCDEEVFQGDLAHKMAARAAIAEWEDTKGSGPATVVTKDEALDLALKHNLASQQTSFVAVSETVYTETGECSRRVIPQFLYEDPEHVVEEQRIKSSSFGNFTNLRATRGMSRSVPVLCAQQSAPVLCAQERDATPRMRSLKCRPGAVASASVASLAGGAVAYGADALSSWMMCKKDSAESGMSLMAGLINEDFGVADECEDEDLAMRLHSLSSPPAPCAAPPPPPALCAAPAPPPAPSAGNVKGSMEAVSAPKKKKQKESAREQKEISRRSIAEPSSDAGDQVFTLCMLQNADGSFALNGELATLARVTVEQLQVVAQRFKLEAHVVATIVAICTFSAFFMDSKDQWELQHDKALRYLKSRHGVEDADIQSCAQSLGFPSIAA